MKQKVYFDYAAATPVDPKVLDVMRPFLGEKFGNPSSAHSAGRAAREALEEARREIAAVLSARPSEIIFTSGSTESANLAINGVLKSFPGTRLAVSAIEHEAVLAASVASNQFRLKVDKGGQVKFDQLEEVGDEIVLIAIQYVNNEVGTIQPVAKFGKLIASLRADRQVRGVVTPLLFYCDAAQAGLQSLQVSRLGVDLLSMGGSKLYGPPGTGFLYVKTGTKLASLMPGGGQEGGLRGGTENVAGAVGLAAALKLMQTGRQAEDKRLAGLRDQLWRGLLGNSPDLILNGDSRRRIGSNLNFSVPGASGETLVAYFDDAGFEVATGSACSEAKAEPSHVLLALGRNREQAESSLRITLGRQTGKEDIDAFIKTAAKIIPRVRKLTASS